MAILWGYRKPKQETPKQETPTPESNIITVTGPSGDVLIPRGKVIDMIVVEPTEDNTNYSLQDKATGEYYLQNADARLGYLLSVQIAAYEAITFVVDQSESAVTKFYLR